MSKLAAAAAVPATAKVVKKKASKPKKAVDHPKYDAMIKQSMAVLKEKGGSSRQAILKYILQNFDVGKDERKINQHLKVALRAGVRNNSIKQAKGAGASGSFKIGEKGTEEKKLKMAPKPVSPKMAPKPVSPKKVKKPKSVKKSKKAKSPLKKSNKPKKVSSPKKASKAKPKVNKLKSPKKALKKTAKKMK